jgi:hypothetical protein
LHFFFELFAPSPREVSGGHSLFLGAAPSCHLGDVLFALASKHVALESARLLSTRLLGRLSLNSSGLRDVGRTTRARTKLYARMMGGLTGFKEIDPVGALPRTG